MSEPHSSNETQAQSAQAPEKPAFHLGGQALIEGVMMRSPHFIAASVRRSDGEIETRVERFHSVLERSPLFRLPFVRGVIALVEMMSVGSRFLRWSSDLVMQDEAAKNAVNSEVAGSKVTSDESELSKSESSTRSATLTTSSLISAAAISHEDVGK